MKPIGPRLAGIAAALSALAVAAPVSTAGAAVVGPAGVPAITVSRDGDAATVTGPTFITIGTATFIDTNIVVSG